MNIISKILKKIKTMPLTVKAALAYTFCIVFSRGLAIITIPIFTRIMSAEEIGKVNLYNSWNGIITIFTTLSLTSGGFSIAMKDFGKQREKYISSILTLTTLLSFVITIIYLINPTLWIKVIGLDSRFIVLMIIGFFLTPAMEFWLAHKRYEYKYIKSSIVIIGSALLSSVLSIVVVFLIKDDQAYNRLLSTYIITYIVSFVIYLSIFIKGKKGIDFKYWNYSLALSLPLVGHALSSQILSTSDRIMISKMIGNDVLGIYGTIYTISSISTMVWSAINASFVPFLYQNIGKNNDSIRKSSFLLLLLYSLIALICVFFAPEIVRIIATPQYYEAIFIMPPIAAGVYFISISNMYSNILIYIKKTKYIMYSSVIAAVLNLILNYVFIKKYGYIAAAYTTLICYIIMAILLYIYANINFKKKEKVELNSVYNNYKILLLSVITTFVSLMGLLLYNNTYIRYLVITILLITAVLLYIKKKNVILKKE